MHENMASPKVRVLLKNGSYTNNAKVIFAFVKIGLSFMQKNFSIFKESYSTV